jgi:tetratricopeptide (TPR) repeat protein
LLRAVVVLAVIGAAGGAWGQEAGSHAAGATRLMQDRLFSEAAAEFEKALAEDTGNYAVRFQYGTCLLAEGRNAEARQQFDAVRQHLGDSPGLDYYLGRLDLLSNDFAGAIRRLRPLEANSDFPQASYYLGLAYLGSGSLPEAIRCLEKAAAKAPGDPQVHYRLARAYSQAGRDADAERQYQAYRQARADEKNTEKDVRACSEALHNRPLEEARAVCRRVQDPNDPERLVVLGQLYGEAGAFADAIEPLQAAAKLDANSFEAWHNLGLSFFRLERYREARAPLERAAALNPNFFDTLNLLAATLYVLGDDAAALPVLERAHKLRPDDRQIAAALEELKKKR